MHWQTQASANKQSPVISDKVDLLFAISCRSLPIDHHWALHTALRQKLPQLADSSEVAVHSIHGADSGNGWIRPDLGLMHPSRRTRLGLRLPKTMLETARQLEEQTLEIDGHTLTVGKSHARELECHKTLFARHIVADPTHDEQDFIAAALRLLETRNITPPRIISGREHKIQTPQATLLTRSIMLDGLSPDESIHLQTEGIGEQTHLGIGIFLPHKSIDAVYSQQDE